MTLVRIIVSLVLVGLGAFWTARELFRQPYYEVLVAFEPQNPITLEGWDRRKSLKEAWMAFVGETGWRAERNRTGYRLVLSQEDHDQLVEWVQDWDQAEGARLGLLQKEQRKVVEENELQLSHLESRRSSLLELKKDLGALAEKMALVSGSRDQVKSNLPASSSEISTQNPTPEENPVPQTAMETEAKDDGTELLKVEDEPTVEMASEVEPTEPLKIEDEPPVEMASEDDAEARFRMRLSTEMNRAQTVLSQGQKELETRLLEGQLGVNKAISARLAGQEHRLVTLLEQQLKSLENQDRNWAESCRLVIRFLDDQLSSLEHECAALKVKGKSLTQRATLDLSSKGMEAPKEALRESFRFFLLGMFLCFIFNLAWEMVVKRDRL